MLDTKQSWDDLVRTHAPDAATRDAILANPLYQNITGKFVQSHDYIAMERLYEIHASGRYDLIVVDTPPTRNAIDFLEAPERMADFFCSRLLRWLIAPYRSRLYNAASKPFYLVADRILGSQFLADIAEFFILFQTMYDGFVERAEAVTRTLQDRRTTFVVVTTLEAAPVREAEFFIDALEGRGFHLGAVVLNKVLPALLRRPRRHAVARSLAKDPDAVAEQIARACAERCPPAPTRRWSSRVLREVGESFLNYRVVATREAEQQTELARKPDIVALGAVLRLRHLRPGRPAPARRPDLALIVTVELTSWQGDITTLDVDAIVNAANERAGPRQRRLRCDLRRRPVRVSTSRAAAIGWCDTGDAVATPAFDLPCRWVIHAVGPIFQDGRSGEADLLAAAYRRSLAVAGEIGARSIAFPAISTGVFGFPAADAARIAVQTVREATERSPVLERVVLVAFDAETARRYQDLLAT